MTAPGKYYPVPFGQGRFDSSVNSKKLHFSQDRVISIFINNGLMFVNRFCNQLKSDIFFVFAVLREDFFLL